MTGETERVYKWQLAWNEHGKLKPAASSFNSSRFECLDIVYFVKTDEIPEAIVDAAASNAICLDERWSQFVCDRSHWHRKSHLGSNIYSLLGCEGCCWLWSDLTVSNILIFKYLTSLKMSSYIRSLFLFTFHENVLYPAHDLCIDKSCPKSLFHV